jgi:peptidyl-prolyl cis-trans isomerase C
MTTVALHHILLRSPLLAQDILNELTIGTSFEDLASNHSACPSKKHQGFAGQHQLDQLPEALYQALNAADGSKPYLGPIVTRYGYHIVKVPVPPLSGRTRVDDPDATAAE